MLMETHSAFMHSQPIANSQTIPMQFTLRSKLLCGWRNTVTIPCTKVITCTCREMEHRYKELRAYRPMLKLDIKIKTVPFICLKHLQNSIQYGMMICYVNVYRK